MPHFKPPGFSSPTDDYRFLTYRMPGGTTISKVADKCRKVADTFFVIRENDKKGEGYHYHAILRMIKEPPRSWYTQGVHVNLKKIGRAQTLVGMKLPQPNPTAQEDLEQLILSPEDLPRIEQRLIDVALAKSVKRTARLKSIERVLQYMSKDYQDRAPIQYQDYCYVYNNKQSPLPP